MVSRKMIERIVNQMSPHAGKKVEKINNLLDTANNFTDAINLPNRLIDVLKSYTIEEVIEKIPKGAHIYVNRSIYSHHGIYDGAGGVYEYQNFTVMHNDLRTFSKGSRILIKDEEAYYSPDEIINRALSRIGEAEYHLFYNNCENFATWCRCGTVRRGRNIIFL